MFAFCAGRVLKLSAQDTQPKGIEDPSSSAGASAAMAGPHRTHSRKALKTALVSRCPGHHGVGPHRTHSRKALKTDREQYGILTILTVSAQDTQPKGIEDLFPTLVVDRLDFLSAQDTQPKGIEDFKQRALHSWCEGLVRTGHTAERH